MQPETNRRAIGIDVGGTTTRIGLVDARGRILSSTTHETPKGGPAATFVSWLARQIAALRSADTSLSTDTPLGLAMPGTIDAARNSVVRSINLPELEGYPLISSLSDAVRTSAALWTDAEAATWAEYRACDHPAAGFLHLRFGTGIGCCLVKHGRLVAMEVERTSHLDQLVAESGPDAIACRCGLRGCLDTIASGVALISKTEELGLGRDMASLESAVQRRDEQAMHLLRRASTGTAHVIERFNTTADVGRVVLGGGVLRGLPSLFEAVIDACGSLGNAAERITSARLGDEAGVIGAGLLALS